MFNGISFQLAKGDIITISGASGSGKTTLLHLLSKVIPQVKTGVFHGQISVKGKNISKYSTPALAKEMGVLWQYPDRQLIFPTVELELAFYPENFNLPVNTIRDRIKRLLQEFAIEDLKDRDTTFLSFGEKKFVALTSLLTYNPDILLLDELTSGLSDKKEKLVVEKIKSLAEQGKAILIADNNPIIDELSHKSINIEDYK